MFTNIHLLNCYEEGETAKIVKMLAVRSRALLIAACKYVVDVGRVLISIYYLHNHYSSFLSFLQTKYKTTINISICNEPL